jgi:O-methyltransferase involved in polyketide biosynthesis
MTSRVDMGNFLDVRASASSEIRAMSHDRTVRLAEGLLAFLPPEAQDHLLDNITGLSAAGSRLVVEIFLSAAGRRPGTGPDNCWPTPDCPYRNAMTVKPKMITAQHNSQAASFCVDSRRGLFLRVTARVVRPLR